MWRKSSAPTKTRIPPEVAGIQTNFCKFPPCKNFGVPAKQTRLKGWHAKRAKNRDRYQLTRIDAFYVKMQCMLCNEIMPVKSNLAISQEHERISRYFYRDREDPARHEPTCSLRSIGFLVDPTIYGYNGKTPSKYKRYQCPECETTFSVGTSTRRQKKPHINKWIFKLLMNKVPFQRICELLEIDMSTLYHKINFLHRQCLAFAADREIRLLKGGALVDGRKKPSHFYVCLDRQEFTVNWTDADDARNTILSAIASADMRTGYVFGMNLNYDPDMDSDDINNDKVKKNDDLTLPLAYREYARLWLETDYQRAEKMWRKPKIQDDPNAALDEDYVEVEEREAEGDVENPETMTGKKLPNRGMQVHEEYTIYGHFMLLKEMLSGAEKVRFYMDRETAIRAACHTAFHKMIKDGDCEAFFIKTHKTMTNKQKNKAFTNAVAAFDAVQAGNKGKKAWEIRLIMLRREMERMTAKGKWKDKWLTHPFPSKSEPEKMVCYLTDIGTYDTDEATKNHLAWLYGKASMHAVNRFFMQIRRRVSLLERAIKSASSTGRSWYGYSPYNPETAQKLIDIFRVFYNYVKPTAVRKRKNKSNPFYDDPSTPTPNGETDPEAEEVADEKKEEDPPKKGKKKRGKTPAMRLGLARAPVRYEDIIYYSP